MIYRRSLWMGLRYGTPHVIESEISDETKLFNWVTASEPPVVHEMLHRPYLIHAGREWLDSLPKSSYRVVLPKFNPDVILIINDREPRNHHSFGMIAFRRDRDAVLFKTFFS